MDFEIPIRGENLDVKQAFYIPEKINNLKNSSPRFKRFLTNELIRLDDIRKDEIKTLKYHQDVFLKQKDLSDIQVKLAHGKWQKMLNEINEQYFGLLNELDIIEAEVIKLLAKLEMSFEKKETIFEYREKYFCKEAVNSYDEFRKEFISISLAWDFLDELLMEKGYELELDFKMLCDRCVELSVSIDLD